MLALASHQSSFLVAVCKHDKIWAHVAFFIGHHMAQGRAVPWSGWEEWELAGRRLLSKDPAQWQRGIAQVSLWRVRGRVPLAVDSTAYLREAQLMCGSALGAMRQGELILLHDVPLTSTPPPSPPTCSDAASSAPPPASPVFPPASLCESLARSQYALALVRLVSGVADSSQKGRMAASVASLASAAELPRALVDLRNEASHNELPSLRALRVAARAALAWLGVRYWARQAHAAAEAARTGGELASRVLELALRALGEESQERAAELRAERVALLGTFGVRRSPVSLAPALLRSVAVREAAEALEGRARAAPEGGVEAPAWRGAIPAPRQVTAALAETLVSLSKDDASLPRSVALVALGSLAEQFSLMAGRGASDLARHSLAPCRDELKRLLHANQAFSPPPGSEGGDLAAVFSTADCAAAAPPSLVALELWIGAVAGAHAELLTHGATRSWILSGQQLAELARGLALVVPHLALEGRADGLQMGRWPQILNDFACSLAPARGEETREQKCKKPRLETGLTDSPTPPASLFSPAGPGWGMAKSWLPCPLGTLPTAFDHRGWNDSALWNPPLLDSRLDLHPAPPLPPHIAQSSDPMGLDAATAPRRLRANREAEAKAALGGQRHGARRGESGPGVGNAAAGPGLASPSSLEAKFMPREGTEEEERGGSPEASQQTPAFDFAEDLEDELELLL